MNGVEDKDFGVFRSLALLYAMDWMAAQVSHPSKQYRLCMGLTLMEEK